MIDFSVFAAAKRNCQKREFYHGLLGPYWFSIDKRLSMRLRGDFQGFE